MLAENSPIRAHSPDPLGLPSLLPPPTLARSLSTQRSPPAPWSQSPRPPAGLAAAQSPAVSMGMVPCVTIHVWMSPWLEELTHVHTENLRRLVFQYLFWKLEHTDKASA